MNTYVLNRSILSSLMSGPTAGAPAKAPAPASPTTAAPASPADCWCVEPEAPALEPLPPKPKPAPAAAKGLHHPTAGGVSLQPRASTRACPKAQKAERSATQTYPSSKEPATQPSSTSEKPAQRRRSGQDTGLLTYPRLPSPPAAPVIPGAASSIAEATQALANPRAPAATAAAPSRQPQQPGDRDAAESFLKTQFSSPLFKRGGVARFGEEGVASIMAQSLTPSMARGLRGLEQSGELSKLVAKAGDGTGVPPQILANTVRSAMNRFDKQAILPFPADASADLVSASRWLEGTLDDSRVIGGKNVMTDRDAAAYMASGMTTSVARGLAAMGSKHIEAAAASAKNDAKIPFDLVAQRIEEALRIFSTTVSPVLENEARRRV